MAEESGSRRVVIAGGGFAGLFAARTLSRAPVQVTLLDRAGHHLFQPLAGRFRELASRTLRRESRRSEPEDAGIMLFDGGGAPLAAFGACLAVGPGSQDR
jgi:glycine/D-amino acid oxidase-like deaminating enzyme